MKKQHLLQIDVIKGLAIVFVLLLHSLPRPALLTSYAVYHIWQAVPLFMVVMGLNLGLSVHAKNPKLELLYTRQYFTKKATRILTPFIIIFILSVPIGLVWQWLRQEDVLAFSWYNLVGILPVTGKGNYFITLLLQSILLLPVIGYAFDRKPVLTTVTLVVLEVVFQIWAADFSYFNKNDYLYDAAFPRYFTAVAYGLWLARFLHQSFRWKQLIVLATLGVTSAYFLYIFTFHEINLEYIRQAWRSQQLLTFGYTAFLVWLAIVVFPSSSSVLPLKLLAELGKASYHIFLVQVIFFGLADTLLPLYLDLLICLSLGYVYFIAEKRWQT